MQKVKLHAMNFISSEVLFVFLCGLYPVVFLVSKNWFVYEIDQLLFLLIIPFLSLLLGLFISAIRYLLREFMSLIYRNKSGIESKGLIRKIRFFRLFFLIIGLGILYFFLYNSIPRGILPAVVIGVISIVLATAVHKKGFRYLNTALFIMVLLASFELLYSSLTKSVKDEFLISGLDKKRNSEIIFAEKPNIYLIHLEAYHSPKALKSIYSIENTEFTEKLNELGFYINEDSFSNYYNTLTTVSAIFLQQHHNYNISSGLEDAVGARDMVGGRLYNPTLDILKNNGYRISFVHTDSYAFAGDDSIDFVFPERKLNDSLLIFQNNLVSEFRASFFNLHRTDRRDYGTVSIPAFYQTLYSVIDTDRALDAPKFYFIKPRAADHAPIKNNYTWRESDDGWAEEYSEMLDKNNPLILEMIAHIVEGDPSGIIILYGDHGGWRYHNIWALDNDRDDVNQVIFDRKGLLPEDLARDVLGGFIGLRYPQGDNRILDGETPVNFFRIIFSELSNNDVLLKDMQTNNGYIDLEGTDYMYILVEDGVPVDKIRLLKKN